MRIIKSRQAYTLLQPRFSIPAGTRVYAFRYHDYGCAADDTAIFGERYTTVTLDPDGGYPFVTVPETFLQPLKGE